MKRKAGKARHRGKSDTDKPTTPMDSFEDYKAKLRKIMRDGGASLLARHKHAQQTVEERITDTEKARKAAKEVVWEKQFPTPRARSREMSRRRRLGIERASVFAGKPKRPKH